MHNDNYTNDRGEKVYGMRLIVSDIEFADSKGEGESQKGHTGRNSSSQSSRNSSSNATGRFNQRSSYQNSSYYQNSNQNKTNRTGNRTQNAQPSRQHSQDNYSVNEQFMNAGGEAMDDFC